MWEYFATKGEAVTATKTLKTENNGRNIIHIICRLTIILILKKSHHNCGRRPPKWIASTDGWTNAKSIIQYTPPLNECRKKHNGYSLCWIKAHSRLNISLQIQIGNRKPNEVLIFPLNCKLSRDITKTFMAKEKVQVWTNNHYNITSEWKFLEWISTYLVSFPHTNPQTT